MKVELTDDVCIFFELGVLIHDPYKNLVCVSIFGVKPAYMFFERRPFFWFESLQHLDQLRGCHRDFIATTKVKNLGKYLAINNYKMFIIKIVCVM